MKKPPKNTAVRLGVLDVGSDTVHLLVVDAHPGAAPVPSATHKKVVRLMRYRTSDGAISDEGVDKITAAIAGAVDAATSQDVEELLPFATSALREATNGASVVAHIERETGVSLRVLSGVEESRLTFLAVRRWYGWSAGRILLLDIGDGSLGIASGIDEYPDLSISVPLGVGRSTIGVLTDDPLTADQVDALGAHARSVLHDVVKEFAGLDKPDHVVGTRLAAMPAEARTALPGISPERTAQIVAGGIVTEQALRAFGFRKLEICPWALREGIILRRLDELG